MATADIYRQYLSDYEEAAKKHNRSANAYQNSLVLQGGPARAKGEDGQEYGLFWTPGTERNVVHSGTEEEYQKAYAAANEAQRQNFGGYAVGQDGKGSWTIREGQNPDAIHAFGSIGSGEGYYSDLGNGVSAMRTGGKATGKFITERLSGDERQAQELRDSGRYKDVRFTPGSGDVVGHTMGNGDESGSPIYAPGSIDVSYEEMAFADKPGEFRAKKPSLSMAQLREIANPTPTMAEAEREGVNDVGLIESARNKFMSAKPGLISSSR